MAVATTAEQIGLIDFERRNACPVCGSCRSHRYDRRYLPLFVLAGAKRFTLADELKDESDLMCCAACDIVYATLVPRVELLKRIYDYSDVTTPFEFGSNRNLDRKVSEVRRRLGSGGSLLDVGCSSGEFLRQFGGCDCWGLDPSIGGQSLHAMQDVRIIAEPLETAELPADYFDVVTMWDVLEHLNDVRTALDTVYRTLKPGGTMIAETGDVSCLPARVLRGRWNYVSPIEHTVFFSRRTLATAISSAGFVSPVFERVFHAKPRVYDVLRRLPLAAFYLSSAILDRRAWAYRTFADMFGRGGAPACLPWLDHLLVMAVKDRPRGVAGRSR